jgi:DHA1 family inner membrane transport protein
VAITVFAIGMIIGAPSTALLTRPLQRRLILTLALAVFALARPVPAHEPHHAVRAS